MSEALVRIMARHEGDFIQHCEVSLSKSTSGRLRGCLFCLRKFSSFA